MADFLPANVTLADVVATHSLNDPVPYLRQAFDNWCRVGGADRQSLFLVIGRTGEGRAPHYQIARAKKGFSLDGADVPPVYYPDAIFNGRNHKPLIALVDRHRESWSTAAISFADMQQLLRETVSGGNRPA